MHTFEPDVDHPLAGDRFPAFPPADYSADMLQRTIVPDYLPDHPDYLAVERVAREMRNQYIASLLSRARRALAQRFAGRARARRSPSR